MGNREVDREDAGPFPVAAVPLKNLLFFCFLHSLSPSSPLPPSFYLSFPLSFPSHMFSVPGWVFILVKVFYCGHIGFEVVIIDGRKKSSPKCNHY